MAKDRNTVAKRQREVEKKRKADEKRERRAKKKQQVDELSPSRGPRSAESRCDLSADELAVLSVFRNYLMGPGKMFCFGGPDLSRFHEPLVQLTQKGLLVKESFQGGYSLTESGFAAMNKVSGKK